MDFTLYKINYYYYYFVFNLLIVDIHFISCYVMSRYNVLYLFGGPTCCSQPAAVQRINQDKTQETGNLCIPTTTHNHEPVLSDCSLFTIVAVTFFKRCPLLPKCYKKIVFLCTSAYSQNTVIHIQC